MVRRTRSIREVCSSSGIYFKGRMPKRTFGQRMVRRRATETARNPNVSAGRWKSLLGFAPLTQTYLRRNIPMTRAKDAEIECL
jgi:hypothetical protein